MMRCFPEAGQLCVVPFMRGVLGALYGCFSHSSLHRASLVVSPEGHGREHWSGIFPPMLSGSHNGSQGRFVKFRSPELLPSPKCRGEERERERALYVRTCVRVHACACASVSVSAHGGAPGTVKCGGRGTTSGVVPHLTDTGSLLLAAIYTRLAGLELS